jgi:hypothetical protein
MPPFLLVRFVCRRWRTGRAAGFGLAMPSTTRSRSSRYPVRPDRVSHVMIALLSLVRPCTISMMMMVVGKPCRADVPFGGEDVHEAADPSPTDFFFLWGAFVLRCGAFAKEKGAPRTFSGNIKRKWRASHFFRIPFCSDGNLKEKRTRRTFWTDSFLIRTVPWRRVVPDRSVGTAGSKIVRCNVPGQKRWERRRP